MPDRPPVSFWCHFPPEQVSGQPAVDAHLRHFERFGLDFLKVMNDHPFPRGGLDVLGDAAGLKRIAAVPGDAGEFADQLDVIRRLRERVGADVMLVATMFNPWATLRDWTGPVHRVHGPPKMDGADERDDLLAKLLKEDRPAMLAALAAIASTLASFAKRCVAAGADGIFLSVRDDWVDRAPNPAGTYDDVVRPLDLCILDAVGGAGFNFLHICGKPRDFRRFADYPVQVLNWADRAAGPSIAYARDRVGPAIAGGVDNLKTLPMGTPDEVAVQVRDALRQAKDRPILITPGCTYDPAAVPEANLKAMVAAARGRE